MKKRKRMQRTRKTPRRERSGCTCSMKMRQRKKEKINGGMSGSISADSFSANLALAMRRLRGYDRREKKGLPGHGGRREALMKLIHCADIHLDSPMQTHMTAQQASVRNTEMLQSFGPG